MNEARLQADPKKIAVLFYTSGMAGPRGGTAFSEALLASSLSRTTELTLVGPRHSSDLDFVRSHGLPLPAEITWLECAQALFSSHHPLRQKVRAADIVHINGHWSLPASFLARVCEKEKVPYVVHPRGMLIVSLRSKQKKAWFNRLIGYRTVRRAARVIALSRFELRQFTPYELGQSQLTVIPNGIVSDGTRATMNPKLKQPYFLYLGRLEARKNLTALIEAFAEHHKRNSSTQLVFVGPTERGYDFLLQKTAETLGVSQAVRILPAAFGADKKAWLCGARAVIYPSVEEAFGRVPFEAIAAGVYPIVPLESGSAEYLSPYLPFCLFSLKEKGDLAKALDRLGAEIPTNAEQALEQAREWVSVELRPDRVAERVHGLYSEILTQTRT